MSPLRRIGVCLCVGVLAGCAPDAPDGPDAAAPAALASAATATASAGDSGRAELDDPSGDEEPRSAAGLDGTAGMPSVAIEFDWVDPLALGESVVVRAADDVLVAYDAPEGGASSVVELANPTPRGGPLVLAAVDPGAAERAEWVEVHLPVRPNGSTAWVRAADVDLFRNPYSVEVSTSEFEMTVFENDEPIVVAEIAVGREVAPTPHGEFFLAELLQPESPDGTYGPFAFGLSGFSDVYTEFAGGDGVIGIHGTNAPDLLGTAASHGCVRVDNETIETLASLLPLGTPVTVSA
ncbi:MAG: L,D-transpeptidase [Actinomycetota bacterium]